jgi:hypothetical protein
LIRIRVWPAVATLPIACAMAAPAYAAERLVSSDATADNVAAYGGVLAWSREAAPGEFRLVVRGGGGIRDAPVRSFRHPVNADLGPAPGGGVVATYARCKKSNLCDVFRLGLVTGRERKLRSISSRRRSEYAISTWRGRSLFGRARVVDGVLYSYRRGGTLKTGPLRRVHRELPSETDLQGSRAAIWLDNDPSVTSNYTAVVVKRFRRSGRGRACTVADASGPSAVGPGDRVYAPVLAGDFVYWLYDYLDYAMPSRSTTRIRRTRLPGSRCSARGFREETPLVDPSAGSLAVDGGSLFYTDRQGVVEATGVAFAP